MRTVAAIMQKPTHLLKPINCTLGNEPQTSHDVGPKNKELAPQRKSRLIEVSRSPATRDERLYEPATFPLKCRLSWKYRDGVTF